MIAVLTIGTMYAIYGIAGLFGFQRIAEKFKGHEWTKGYIRRHGLAFILLGVSWIALGIALSYITAAWFIVLLLLAACSLPACVYALCTERKYSALLEDKQIRA